MKRLLSAGLLGAMLLCMPLQADAHEYDSDDSDHPLRYVAYVLHVPGKAVEKLVLRPVHRLVMRPAVAEWVGHETLADAPAYAAHVFDTSQIYSAPAPAEVEPVVEQAVAPAPAAPADAPIERTWSVQAFPEAQTIFFDYDSSKLRADKLARLEQNLALLRENPEIGVQVIGHTRRAWHDGNTTMRSGCAAPTGARLAGAGRCRTGAHQRAEPG